jgi:hypothetical protein
MHVQAPKNHAWSLKIALRMSLVLQKSPSKAKMLRKLLAQIQNALLLAFADPIKNNRFKYKQHLFSL